MTEDIERWLEQKKLFGDSSITLGKTYSYLLKTRAKQFFFTMARYKFASKMVGPKPGKTVLDLGCNEGLGASYFVENNQSYIGVDFDEEAIKWGVDTFESDTVKYFCEDFLGKKYKENDAVISLDVIEHIPVEKEELFIQTLKQNMKPEGMTIVGTPNLSAKQYSSAPSLVGHVNLYSADRLRESFERHFHNVFIFGMNDEVVHTGFYDMCHYLFVIACNIR